jgi:hypothetical protein
MEDGAWVWTFWHTILLALTVGGFLLMAALYFGSLTSNLSVEGDNAIYIILARAMALGKGYTNIQTAVPRAEAQYPFLFPLLLLPIVARWGTDAVFQMEALVSAFALGAFMMGLIVFRRWFGSTFLALTVALGAASTDLVWEFSHKVLTEVPYLFFTLVACWCLTRYCEDDSWWAWSGVGAALAAAAAFLTRTIGVSICLALPLALLLAPGAGRLLPWRSPWPVSRPVGAGRERGMNWWLRAQKALFVSFIVGLIGGGWTLRNHYAYAGQQGHNYIGQFFLKQTYVPSAGSVQLDQLWSRLGGNIAYYARVYERMVGGHVWDHVTLSGRLSPALLVVTCAGFCYALVRRRTVAEPYVCTYVTIVLLWPWQDLRFAVPILPFLFYYMAHALIAAFNVLARWRPIDPRIAAALVLAVLSAPGTVHTIHTAQADRAKGYHYEVERLGEWPAYPDWRAFHAAAEWLKVHAAPGSTVINRSPNLLYLWTGLWSRNYPYSFDKASMIRDITREGDDYILKDDFAWTYTTGLYLDPVLRQYKQMFKKVYQVHGTVVYQFVPAGAAAHATTAQRTVSHQPATALHHPPTNRRVACCVLDKPDTSLATIPAAAPHRLS